MTPGVVGSPVEERLGETGNVGLLDLVLESCVTGRMVVPLKKGELDEDLGERGVRGLSPSELWPPGDSGDEIFTFVCRENELRSKLGTAECRDGIFTGVNRGSRGWPRVENSSLLWLASLIRGAGRINKVICQAAGEDQSVQIRIKIGPFFLLADKERVSQPCMTRYLEEMVGNGGI